MQSFSILEQIHNIVDNPKGTFFYLHSFMGNFQMKNSFKNYYSNYNFHAFNMPGHGNSILENIEQIKIPYCINLVKSYIEAFDLKDLILFGHSLGGGVLAALNELIPERIKLNIFEAPANGIMSKNIEIIHKLIPNTLEDTKLIINKMYYDPQQLFGSRLDSIISTEYLRCKEKFTIFKANFKNETVNQNSLLFDKGFKNIKVPSLVILGETDGILPTNMMLEHFKSINNPNLLLNVVPKSAHAIYSEQKNIFLKLVDTFLGTYNG